MIFSHKLSQLTDTLINRVRVYAEYYPTPFIFFWHLVFAAFFFSPYFLFNYVLLANLDMPNFNVPMLILAKRELLSGGLGLWNPYVLGGTSSLLSAQAPMYNLIDAFNWILLIIPEKYLLLVGTFLPFVKLWLAGILAYFIFHEEIKSKKWAFFASTIFQLCGFTLWNTFIFELSSMWLWIMAAIYLIWTAYQRPAYLNYILLTLVLIQFVLPSYIIVVIYAFIFFGILMVYRYLSQRGGLSHWTHLVVSVSALGTTGLIFLLRLLPTWAEASQTSRVTSFAWDFDDLSFLGLRLFNPEILGVNFLTSYQLINGPFTQFKDVHIHAFMPQFFGVLPALLLLWAIASSPKNRATFWLVYTLIALATLMRLEPFDTLARVLLQPVHHPQGLQIFLPIGLCVLAGLTAKELEAGEPHLFITPLSFWLFNALALIVTGYFAAIWLLQFSRGAILFGAGMVVIGVLAALTGWGYYLKPKLTTRILVILGLTSLILIAILSLSGLLLATDPNTTFISHLKNISVSLLVLTSIYANIWLGLKDAVRLKAWAIPGAAFLLIIFLWVTLYPWTQVLFEQLSKIQDAQLAIMGTIRFLIVWATFITVIYFLKLGLFKKQWLFPLFFLILIFDLLPASKIHSFLLNNPFYRDSTLFPFENLQAVGVDGTPLTLDTQNYRVNRPHALLQLPYYRAYYGSEEYLSTAFAVYGIRSYGGYYNGLSNHYRKFIETLAPSARAPSHGLYMDIKDQRFLDLYGVRYDYDPGTEVVKIRPQALPRFSLFPSYRLITSEQETLDLLKNPRFPALETIILNTYPGFSSGSMAKPTPLVYVESSSDVLEVQVYGQTPGIVFFNDTYNSGWRAYVNGQEEPVLQADYNFMAVAVPAGQSQVVWRFQPISFRYGLYLAGAGFILFGLIATSLYLLRNRLDLPQEKITMARTGFMAKVLTHLKIFKLVYLSFIFLLLVALAQALFNYHNPSQKIDRSFKPAVIIAGKGYKSYEALTIQTIEIDYKTFNILLYQGKFYALNKSLGAIDLTKIDKKTLAKCLVHEDYCLVEDTLAKVKERIDHLYDKLPPIKP